MRSGKLSEPLPAVRGMKGMKAVKAPAGDGEDPRGRFDDRLALGRDAEEPPLERPAFLPLFGRDCDRFAEPEQARRDATRQIPGQKLGILGGEAPGDCAPEEFRRQIRGFGRAVRGGVRSRRSERVREPPSGQGRAFAQGFRLGGPGDVNADSGDEKGAWAAGGLLEEDAARLGEGGFALGACDGDDEVVGPLDADREPQGLERFGDEQRRGGRGAQTPVMGRRIAAWMFPACPDQARPVRPRLAVWRSARIEPKGGSRPWAKASRAVLKTVSVTGTRMTPSAASGMWVGSDRIMGEVRGHAVLPSRLSAPACGDAALRTAPGTPGSFSCAFLAPEGRRLMSFSDGRSAVARTPCDGAGRPDSGRSSLPMFSQKSPGSDGWTKAKLGPFFSQSFEKQGNMKSELKELLIFSLVFA